MPISLLSIRVWPVEAETSTLYFENIVSKMSFGDLIFQLDLQQRKCIRNVEKISKKLISDQFAVIFNDICIQENLLPKYTNIYIYIAIYSIYV